MMVGDAVRFCCSFPTEKSGCLSNTDAPLLCPSPSSVPEGNWDTAEEATRGVISRIHPTVPAHSNRNRVIHYMQSLIKFSLGFQVFPYGSVPLKTYLPDGDIDLTAISSGNVEDALVGDVHAVLRAEEVNKDAPFEVKDIHRIDAEVKIIKCLVQNIVVDISFNQFGGLSSLCFLEQVDQIVGKGHLFKRSILLIKAWCYYESRILGAHHGLLSTFLDYFSKFDWENYCVSLNGPVLKSSLPDIVAKLPEGASGELLLSDEFLKKSADMFSVPLRRVEKNSRAFPQKHLNIIDPLKENNNLGRSVNRGNFYRIRSAFKYGTHKLGRILLSPVEEIADELNKFFANILGCHRSNYWTVVQNPALASGTRSSDNSLSSHFDTYSEDNISLKLKDGYSDAGGLGISCSSKSHHAPHFNFSAMCGEGGASCRETISNFVTDDQRCCTLRPEFKKNQSVVGNSVCSCTNHDGIAAFSSAISTATDNLSENLTLTPGTGISGSSHSLKSLLDLSGDYDSHFRSVLYGRYCHLYTVPAPTMPFTPRVPKPQSKVPLETLGRSLQLMLNACPQMKLINVLGPRLYCVNPPTSFNTAFNSDEKKKRKGTGTYIPDMSYQLNEERASSGRGRNQTSGIHDQLHRRARDNDMAVASQDSKLFEHGRELSETEYPHLVSKKSLSADAHQSYSSVWEGFSRPADRKDSGFQAHRLSEGPLPEGMTPSESGPSCSPASSSRPISTTEQNRGRKLENEKERVELQTHHLKDEVDFPPLALVA